MNEAILNLPPSRWKCTAAKAAACSLPRNLENAALALELPVQKNMDGRRLILKYSKPKPQWTKWNIGGRIGPEPKKWYDNEFELWSIYDYCVTDTDVERHLDRALPDLIPSEQKHWELNQYTNLNGVHIDIEAVTRVIKMIKTLEKEMQGRLQNITGHFVESASQRDKMVEWLRLKGLEISDLRAGTVKEILERDDLSTEVRAVLTIRQLVSKTSNKKYFAFLDRTCADDLRARDLLLWHGANTGRNSAVGIQIHNFPRGIHKNTDAIIDDILEYDIDTLKVLYGDLLQLFSSCLRGMIKATKGFELFRADFNAIECRVLNWISGNVKVLDGFAKGVDQYKIMASRIFNKPINKITDDERFIGKVAVLACGYGMGWRKFLTTCVDSFGIKTMTEDLAKKAVQVYRESHYKVTQAWYNVERAAILAISKPGTVVKVHKVKFFVKDKFLWCELPSGRRLAYFKPSVKMKDTPWGEPKPCVHYWAVNSQTRKFERVHTYGGSLVENICQAISADVMRNGVENAVKSKFGYLFDVHDELVCEAKTNTKTIEDYIRCLVTLPKWADGLPVKAEGWVGPRFKK